MQLPCLVVQCCFTCLSWFSLQLPRHPLTWPFILWVFLMTASHWRGFPPYTPTVLSSSMSCGGHLLVWTFLRTQLTTLRRQYCLTWPLVPSTLSQWGPSLWPLDHSVNSWHYTLLMVRTCCTDGESLLICEIIERLIYCIWDDMYETERWTEVDGSKLLLFILFFTTQSPQYLKVSVPSALVPPPWWWLGWSLLCPFVSCPITAALWFHACYIDFLYVHCCALQFLTLMPLHCLLLAHDNSQTTYEVQYRGVDSPNDVDETFNEAVIVTPGMTLSLTISGLMPYSVYNVSVRATNQYGVGGFSEEVTVQTEEGGE